MKKLSTGILLVPLCFVVSSILFSACKGKASSILVKGSDYSIKRAVAGDCVWVLVNHVKAGKEKEFEHFVHDLFWDGSAQLTSSDQLVFRQTRVLHPTKKEADGSSRYIFIMDPLIPGADYHIASLMKKIYGEQKSNEYMKLWEDATSAQDQYLMVQSRH
jgi:hypothetical protein